MKIIGITGPTGAGKTTALEELRALGAEVIDADAVYHRLLAEDRALGDRLEELFGPLRDEGGDIDRKKLGAIVFGDPAQAAVDAIALLESPLAGLCTDTVAVLAPPEVRVRRIMAREGIPEDYARARVAAQKEDGFFRRGCRHVLDNDGDDPAAFAAEARALFRHILSDPGETGTKE